MKLASLALFASVAIAAPVFEVPGLSLDVSPWEASQATAKSQHGARLQKRVTTIAQNNGISIGAIVGNALGEQVLSVLPKAKDYNGLIDTLLALVGKANQKFGVPETEQAPLGVDAHIKHHKPDPTAKAPIIRLLEQARDAPASPWAGVGSLIGSPIGKEFGKLLETA